MLILTFQNKIKQNIVAYLTCCQKQLTATQNETNTFFPHSFEKKKRNRWLSLILLRKVFVAKNKKLSREQKKNTFYWRNIWIKLVLSIWFTIKNETNDCRSSNCAVCLLSKTNDYPAKLHKKITVLRKQVNSDNVDILTKKKTNYYC